MATDYKTLLAQWQAAQAGLAPELQDQFGSVTLPDGSHIQNTGGALNLIGAGSGLGSNYQQYGSDGSVNTLQSKAGHSWLDPIANQLGWAVPAMIAAGTGAGMLGYGSGAAAAPGWTSGFDIATGGALDGMGGAAAAGGASGASSALGSAASGAGEASAAGFGGFAPNAVPAGMEGGMGLTGAGGIGSATSAIGAGAGAANYGAGMSWLDSLGLPSGLTDVLGSKAVGALAGGLLSGVGGTSQAGTQTVTNKQEIDPRMASILYGSNGNNGFLSQLLSAGSTPQSSGMQAFGSGMNSYLGNWGTDNLMKSQQAAQRLQDSNINAPTAGAAQVNAPSQNGLDLSHAYNDMIYGQAGNNPYLTGAIQKGINQSNNAFGNMMMDATRNLNQNVLPSIRSGAIINGSMGSSRQGIAESNALNDYSTQMGRAISQFGQNNTDAAVSAQAGAYDADRNRALSAMSGLGAQQYGVASQNAQMQQQANLANLQSQLSTNALNSQNQLGGLNASQNVLNNAYTYGTNQDAYNLNKIGKVSGLLSPYTGLGGSSTQSQPLYENKASNILGGALLGSKLFG